MQIGNIQILFPCIEFLKSPCGSRNTPVIEHALNDDNVPVPNGTPPSKRLCHFGIIEIRKVRRQPTDLIGLERRASDRTVIQHQSANAAPGEVKMGATRTASGSEVLVTRNLLDSCAVAFLTDYDQERNEYLRRTLMNVSGSDLSSRLVDESRSSQPAGEILSSLVRDRKGDRHKLIVGFGELSSSGYAQYSLFNDESMIQAAAVCGGQIEYQTNETVLAFRSDGSPSRRLNPRSEWSVYPRANSGSDQ